MSSSHFLSLRLLLTQEHTCAQESFMGWAGQWAVHWENSSGESERSEIDSWNTHVTTCIVGTFYISPSANLTSVSCGVNLPCGGNTAGTWPRWSDVQEDFPQSVCTCWPSGCSPHLRENKQQNLDIRHVYHPAVTRATGELITHGAAPGCGRTLWRWAAARAALGERSWGSRQERGHRRSRQSSQVSLNDSKYVYWHKWTLFFPAVFVDKVHTGRSSPLKNAE